MTDTTKRSQMNAIGLGLLIPILGLAGYKAYENTNRPSQQQLEAAAKAAAPPPRVVNIADNQNMDILAGRAASWDWTVEPSQPTCRLTGHVQVSEGGSKDVEVFLATADDYSNFTNGHAFRAYFQSGKTTAVTLDVTTTHVGPMTLWLSNRFSVLTSKSVQLRDIRVTCR